MISESLVFKIMYYENGNHSIEQELLYIRDSKDYEGKDRSVGGHVYFYFKNPNSRN